jgi:hypothetical protein
VQLFYFISCFCIDKIQKNQISNFFFPVFGFLLSPWNSGLAQCGRTQVLCGRTHLGIFQHSPRACARLTRLCVRARAPVLNQAVQCTFERTSIAFERTCRFCYTFTWLRSIAVPALERTSAAAAANPRQVCVLFFCFFLFSLIIYLFIYLFCPSLFIYLLFY